MGSSFSVESPSQVENLEKLLILDFEANFSKPGSRDHEVCEFPCVLIRADTGAPIAEFRSFVKPVMFSEISQACHELTGITDENIFSGKNWIDVRSFVAGDNTF